MTLVLIDCPKHGLLPSEVLFDLSAGANVSFANSTTSCPACGRKALIIDGEYRVDQNLEVTANLRLTPAQLERLRTVLEYTKANTAQANPTKAAADMERALRKEAPGIGKILDLLSGKRAMGIAAWVGVLLAIGGVVVQLGAAADGLSVEELARAIAQSAEQMRQEPEATTPTGPQPEPGLRRVAPEEEIDS